MGAGKENAEPLPPFVSLSTTTTLPFLSPCPFTTRPAAMDESFHVFYCLSIRSIDA